MGLYISSYHLATQYILTTYISTGRASNAIGIRDALEVHQVGGAIAARGILRILLVGIPNGHNGTMKDMEVSMNGDTPSHHPF